MNIFELIKRASALDEPQPATQPASRRDALEQLTRLGRGAALAAVPAVVSGLWTKAEAQVPAGEPTSLLEILNFALLAEYTDSTYYQEGLNVNGLIPASDRAVFEQLLRNEMAQVDTLKTTITSLGGTPVAKPNFDFTGGGRYTNWNSNYQTYLAVAQAFEDLGVRAYKGQANKPALMANKPVLEAALRIHSVEARHAAEIRRLRGKRGWITGIDAEGSQADIYTGATPESNTTHLGIARADYTTVAEDKVSQAFDEPLTGVEVKARLALFIRP
ncbi:ferritin-like domain-containing protein [Hymenobacter sp. 15J16-1T3B]|uniref:ferritin-like domain-containing protein n=1 Tax=Hymenobacter sp. 15J16-1T3B TaxID=2886941 RepID=UPI001D12139A|nr:ferritin-like domain-containing protein [Hymenobacter sp. 15J16-1T3B]MCC3159248.1 ferritin-like domain-containing protein [Hymenobacter sp. 15J16-1T3B]